MSETLQVTRANALKAFNQANDKGKTLLSNLFGEKVFTQKITERVKTFEDACEVLGISDPTQIFFQSKCLLTNAMKGAINHMKLCIIAEALNEGWQPDYSNSSEYKYYPWFDFVPGSGFRFGGCARGCTNTYVGSRLVYRTRELAEYAGKQFEDLYNEYLSM